MSRLVYWAVLALLYPLSLLPFRVLYRISDVLAFLLNHLLRYRRTVICDNLAAAFPDKSEAERKIITAQFYRDIADLLVEQIKLLTVPLQPLLNRVEQKNFELVDAYLAERRPIICVTGHYGNWEYSAVIREYLRGYRPWAIYMPLKNRHFDGLMKRLRTRFGFGMLPVDEVQEFFRNPPTEPPPFVLFLSDQAPSEPRRAWWTSFLHQDTPVFLGPELMARRYDLPVVWADIRRVRRGHYLMELIDISARPRETAAGEITERHVRMLERQIERDPSQWLWSHRRWKHRRPEGARGRVNDRPSGSPMAQPGA